MKTHTTHAAMRIVLASSLGTLWAGDTNQKPQAVAPTGIYTGRLGVYRSLLEMRLTESNGVLTGSCQFAKHGKPLLLKGSWDAETGQGTMTEHWEGTQTGTFEFTVTEDGLQGQWISAETDRARQRQPGRVLLQAPTEKSRKSAYPSLLSRVF